MYHYVIIKIRAEQHALQGVANCIQSHQQTKTIKNDGISLHFLGAQNIQMLATISTVIAVAFTFTAVYMGEHVVRTESEPVDAMHPLGTSPSCIHGTFWTMCVMYCGWQLLTLTLSKNQTNLYIMSMYVAAMCVFANAWRDSVI
jgi:hypothetical protein